MPVVLTPVKNRPSKRASRRPRLRLPLVEIDRPFIVALREEKVFPKRGRWMANYVVTVLSLLFEYAIDRGGTD